MKYTLHISERQGGDWGQDLIHAGLVKFLGPERVIDYPFHTKHVEPLVFNGDHEHDWGLERRTVGYTEKNGRVGVFGEGLVRDMIRRGDVERIFIDERPESYSIYLSLRANFFDVPVVVVAGHDSFQSKLPPWEVSRLFGKNLEAMFLDNWIPAYGSIPRTYIYNWSANFDHYWNGNREQDKLYDLSFMGYNSHPDRARFVDHILKRWGHLKLLIELEREPGTMRSFVRKQQYFDVMAQSKVCLNLRGAAENGKTLRFYEIPYVGSLMLTQDSGAEQVYPFKDKNHCLYFRDEKTLDRCIEQFADDSLAGPREQIARQGHTHLMKHHTVLVRIRQIYETLGAIP